MPRQPGLPPSLQALLDTSMLLARRAPSARVAMARASDLLPSRHSSPPDAEPLESRVVERALHSAWGRSPARLLDDWDPEPLAVRPAAQVHRGRLDGRWVAVKVLRPGLATTVRADLALLEALVPALAAAFPRLDAAGVVAEVREATLDELDLEHEGDTLRLVGRALRGVPGLVVPAVEGELTSESVLVTELLEGATLRDGGRPDDPEAAARALLHAHLEAVRRAGLVPTDPRPGHVVPGPRLGLLGAGVARPWPAERMQGLLDALAALRDPDGADTLAAVLDARLGVLPADVARVAHPLGRELLGGLLTGPARLDAEALRELGRRALERAPELAGLAARATPRPDDLAGLRSAGQLVATLAAIGATLDWVAELLS